MGDNLVARCQASGCVRPLVVSVTNNTRRAEVLRASTSMAVTSQASVIPKA